MIFVTVGTNEAPFDRLVRAVDGIGGDERVVCQHGASALRPSRATCVDYLSFDQLVEHVCRARAVVMHAGVGSLLVALAHGRRPIVVPRRHRFGEAVDDHQLPLARHLADSGLVRLVTDPSLLAAELELVGGDGEVTPVGTATGLAKEVGEYVAGLVAPRG